MRIIFKVQNGNIRSIASLVPRKIVGLVLTGDIDMFNGDSIMRMVSIYN